MLEKKRPQADTLKAYSLSYTAFRFAIEFFRGDVVHGIFHGLSTAQWVSLGIAVYYLSRQVRKQKAVPEAAVNATNN